VWVEFVGAPKAIRALNACWFAKESKLLNFNFEVMDSKSLGSWIVKADSVR
jgi:hypothetical protein